MSLLRSKSKANDFEREGTDVYHIIFRNSGKLNAFRDEADRRRFLKILDGKLKLLRGLIYAFILMDTHVHVLVKCKDINLLVKYVYCAYVGYFAARHSFKGHIFDWPATLAPKPVLKWQLDNLIYIVNNPVVAGLCKSPGGWKYSSFNFYFGRRNPLRDLIDVDASIVRNAFKDVRSFKRVLAAKAKYEISITRASRKY